MGAVSAEPMPFDEFVARYLGDDLPAWQQETARRLFDAERPIMARLTLAAARPGSRRRMAETVAACYRALGYRVVERPGFLALYRPKP